MKNGKLFLFVGLIIGFPLQVCGQTAAQLAAQAQVTKAPSRGFDFSKIDANQLLAAGKSLLTSAKKFPGDISAMVSQVKIVIANAQAIGNRDEKFSARFTAVLNIVEALAILIDRLAEVTKTGIAFAGSFDPNLKKSGDEFIKATQDMLSLLREVNAEMTKEIKK